MKPTIRTPAAPAQSRRRAAVADPAQEGADSRVWEAFRTELLRFVVKRVRDAGLAEDIVHDVLHKAYAQRDSLREFGRLRPWLFQIARNAIVDGYRARRPTVPLPDEVGGEAGCSESAERELARCLKPLLKRLPVSYRQAVTLAELEGLAQGEVATRLGLSLSGAKSRVQRGRRMLAESLQDCCRVELDRRGGIAGYECQSQCGPCGDVRKPQEA